MTNRRTEPILWFLFSAGGVLTAMLIPILLLLFGVVFPLGWIAAPTHQHLYALLSHPLTRLLLFFLCMLALFHWAHRFRYTLYDGLQIKQVDELLNGFCYGGAIIGTIIAGCALWRA